MHVHVHADILVFILCVMVSSCSVCTFGVTFFFTIARFCLFPVVMYVHVVWCLISKFQWDVVIVFNLIWDL